MQLNYSLIILAIILLSLLVKPIAQYICEANLNKKIVERLYEEGEQELSKHNIAAMNNNPAEARIHAYAFETFETVLVGVDPIGFDKRFNGNENNKFLYEKMLNDRHWERY